MSDGKPSVDKDALNKKKKIENLKKTEVIITNACSNSNNKFWSNLSWSSILLVKDLLKWFTL